MILLTDFIGWTPFLLVMWKMETMFSHQKKERWFFLYSLIHESNFKPMRYRNMKSNIWWAWCSSTRCLIVWYLNFYFWNLIPYLAYYLEYSGANLVKIFWKITHFLNFSSPPVLPAPITNTHNGIQPLIESRWNPLRFYTNHIPQAYTKLYKVRVGIFQKFKISLLSIFIFSLLSITFILFSFDWIN